MLTTVLTASAVLLLTKAQQIIVADDTTTSIGFLSPMEIYPVKSSQSGLKDVQYNCQYLAGLNFYDLQLLAVAKPMYEVNVTNSTIFQISFCHSLPEEYWCNDQESMAVLRNTSELGGGCVTLSGPDPTKNAAFTVANETANDGININYSGGDPGWNLTIQIQCLQENYNLIDGSFVN